MGMGSHGKAAEMVVGMFLQVVFVRRVSKGGGLAVDEDLRSRVR